MTTYQDYHAAPIHDAGEWTPRITPLRLRHVVVGIDGSRNSVEALRFAGRLAARDGAKVEAVCVFRPFLHTPYPLGTVMVPSYGPAGEGSRDVYASPGGVLDAAAEAQATLEQAARDAFGTDTLPNLILRAIDGCEHSAHEVLTTMAAGADLLVVGARGHSGPLGLLLGSTAQSCTRHAKCAVLVVPATDQH
ncbi:MAG TPA: universal stress protein [Acidothermaceae bacterium]|jgi:nucleotide-binding universal stress UspA family protein